jgi:ligand-binding SRPBCC domain-containing protein
VGIFQLETLIRAPIERCFDLSRSVDVHLASAKSTNERAIAGVVKGLMNLGDVVTWEAKHFGVNHRMTVRISEFERPRMFADIQVKGPFKRFRHTHHFELSGAMTLMKDVFELECPFGLVGALVDPIVTRHLRKFLIQRNQVIKEIAEGEAWRSILV